MQTMKINVQIAGCGDEKMMLTKKKKAQMKIQQMAFMLIAVTLFFVLAALFIITIRFSGLRGSAELLEEKNALLLASKLADSPEFACGDTFGQAMTNCIDTDKAIALKENIGKYRGFWGAGVDGIEIRWIAPVERQGECNIENYPDCGKITFVNANSGTGIANFVSLCRKESDFDEGMGIYDKCELGRIIVTYNKDD